MAFIECDKIQRQVLRKHWGRNAGFGMSCAGAFPIYVNTRSLNEGAAKRYDLKIVHRGVKPLLPIEAHGRCPYAN